MNDPFLSALGSIFLMILISYFIVSQIVLWGTFSDLNKLQKQIKVIQARLNIPVP